MAKRGEVGHRGWFGLVTAMFGAVCVGGCGITQPIEVPATERLFVPDPYRPGATGPCADSYLYAEGLGTEICNTDSLRLKWMEEAAQVSNNAVNFNALSWPFGSAALYYSLKVSDSTLLLPAAMAAGLYGFLNSGIPGRDAIDRKAAKALACAIVDASADLYTAEEFDGFRGALRRLDWAIRNVEAEQGRLVDGLRVARSGPSKADPDSNPDSIRRLTGGSPERGRGGAADPRPTLERYLADRLAWAREIWAKGQTLEWTVAGSAARLQALRAQVALERQTALAEKAPAMRNPAETQKGVAEFVKGFQEGAAALLAAQSGQTKKDAGKMGVPKADPKFPTVPSAVLRPLTSKAIQDWRDFETLRNQNLQAAVLQVRRWTDEHKLRQDQTRETGQAIGCDSPEALPVASGGSGSSGNRRRSALPENGEPPPGTPLPSLGGQP